MTRGRIPPVVLIVGRSALVLLAVVPLLLLLTRAAPPAPAGVAGPPDGLGGMGTGVLDGSDPGAGPTSSAQPSGPPGADRGRTGSVPTGGPGAPVPGQSATNPGGTGVTSPSPTASPTDSSDPTGRRRPLRASYQTIDGDPFGSTPTYTGQITIINPGEVEHRGWTVTLELPAGEIVQSASGAGFSQSGVMATFTPRGDGIVPANGAVSFTFVIGGTLTGWPPHCTINGRGCG